MKPARRNVAAFTIALLFLPAAYVPTLRQAFAQSAVSETSTWAEEFSRMSPAEFKAWMDARRPVRRTEAERDGRGAAIAPEQQLIVLRGDPRAERLRRITRPVLSFHGCEGSIEFVIFYHPEPLAYSLAGAWVAVSTGLLERAQNDDQLSAIVAHEMAHQYFLTELRIASEAGDLAQLRQIELGCDAVAAATMIALGKDPRELKNILSIILNSSPEMQRNNDGTGDHPALVSRLDAISTIERSLARNWRTAEQGYRSQRQ